MGMRLKLTCLVCFSSAVSFSIAAVTFVYKLSVLIPTMYINIDVYLSELLSFWQLFVNLLREVLVRLAYGSVRHCCSLSCVVRIYGIRSIQSLLFKTPHKME